MFVMYSYRCFSRDWRVIDYGICDLMDLLTEIPDTTITITHQDTDTVISVPKRGPFKLVNKKMNLEVVCSDVSKSLKKLLIRMSYNVIDAVSLNSLFICPQSVLWRKWSALGSLGRRWWTFFVTSLTAEWPSVSSYPPTTITSVVSANSATTASPSSWSSSRQSPTY